jgi:hypothetical protein
VRVLLRKRQDAQLAARSNLAPAVAAVTAVAPAASAPAAPPANREALGALRKELNGLVGAWSHRTGQPHGVIHNELRRQCGGPPLPQASASEITSRIDRIRQWALSGR